MCQQTVITQSDTDAMVVPENDEPDGKGRKGSCIEDLLEFQSENSWMRRGIYFLYHVIHLETCFHLNC